MSRLLALVLALALPAAAVAQEPVEPMEPATAPTDPMAPERPTPASTVVVHAAAEGAEAAAADAWLTQFGHGVGVRFVPVLEVFPAEQPVVLVGQADVRFCDAEPVDGTAFSHLVDRVADHVLMMEYLEAAVSLGAIDEALPCLVEAPPPTVLGRYHVLRGLVAFYAETPEAATDRFEEGLLVSPFLQWDETWPPQVRPSFDAAVTGALTAGTAFLSISGRLTSEGTLWLDGLEVDPRTRTTTLYEGTHLLQWKDPAGHLSSWLATVGEGDSLQAVHRGDAVDLVLTGTAERPLADHARERVLAPVEREAGGRLVVAQPWEVVLFHEYDAAFGRWWLTDLAQLQERRQSGRRMKTAGGVMIGAGVATALVGGLLSAVGNGQASTTYDEIFPERVTLDDGTQLARGSSAVRDQESSYYAWTRDLGTAGTGIVIGGGTVAIAGIPLVVHGHRRATATGLHREQRPGAGERPARGSGKSGKKKTAPE